MKNLSLAISLYLVCLIVNSTSFASQLIFFVPSARIFASNLTETIFFNEIKDKSKVTKYPNQITIDLQKGKTVGVICKFDLSDFGLIENQLDDNCKECKVNLDNNVDVRIWRDAQNGTLMQLQKDSDSTMLILLPIGCETGDRPR